MLKKLFAVMIAFTVLLSACHSGTVKNSSNGTISGTDAEVVKNSNAESSSIPVLRIATIENWYSSANLTSGLPIWKEIEKKLNIRIEWEVSSWSQYMVNSQTRLAAAVELPDIMRVPNGDPTMYGQAGLLIPLEDLIEKHGKNIQKVFEKYKTAKSLMLSGDGHLYGLAPITEESSHIMPLYWIVREDWLENLNLKTPETLDDFYNVMKAFQEQDPNQNGKNDEKGWRGMIEPFASAFGLHLTISGPVGENGGFWVNKEGKVIYQYILPQYKEYLTFIKKLYDEGILSKDIGSQSAESEDMLILTNKVGIMHTWPDLAISWSKELRKSGVKSARFIPVAPPLGPDGQRSIEGYGIVDDGYHGITKDCKNPELAIEFIDYLWSEEGIRELAWGIEGKSYVMENGKPKYTDYVLNNKDGLGASDALRALGAWPTVPWIQQADSYMQILSSDENFDNCWNLIKPYIVQPFKKMLSTKEENDKILVLLDDIDSYVNEMTIKFVTGRVPLSSFESYVNKVKEMGINDVVTIKQHQYDRFLDRK